MSKIVNANIVETSDLQKFLMCRILNPIQAQLKIAEIRTIVGVECKNQDNGKTAIAEIRTRENTIPEQKNISLL